MKKFIEYEKKIRLTLKKNLFFLAYETKICGPVVKEGVELVEAIRWGLDIINQDSGEVFGQRVTSSLIPGVKIGAKNSNFFSFFTFFNLIQNLC